ncbi:MAG: hypothetical protein QXK47_01520 [Candidatus Bathyarchaeia archaeon]
MGFSTTISYVKELPKNDKIFDNETLSEYNNAIFASEMEEGDFFEINISASNNVRVKVGNVGRDPFGNPITTDPILFEDYGNNIIQRVNVTGKGTYQVEIINEGTGPVILSGFLYAKKSVKIIQVLHPYSSLGTLLLLLGVGVLFYGILAKPRRLRARRRLRETK